MGLLSDGEHRILGDLLLKLPDIGIADSRARRQLVEQLPRAIHQQIPFSNIARNDVTAIIEIVDHNDAQLPNGTWPILWLIEDALFTCLGTDIAADLETLLTNLRTRATSLTSTSIIHCISPGIAKPLGKVQILAMLALKHLIVMRLVLVIRDPGAQRLQTINVRSPNGTVLSEILIGPLLSEGKILRELRSIQPPTEVLVNWLDKVRTTARQAGEHLDECFKSLDQAERRYGTQSYYTSLDTARGCFTVTYDQCVELIKCINQQIRDESSSYIRAESTALVRTVPSQPPAHTSDNTAHQAAVTQTAVGSSITHTSQAPSQTKSTSVGFGQPGSKIRLERAQQERFLDVLLKIFHNLKELKQRVYFDLGVDLDEITGDTNRKNAIFDLIRWADVQDRIGDLITIAHKQAPKSQALNAFIKQIRQYDTDQSITP